MHARIHRYGLRALLASVIGIVLPLTELAAQEALTPLAMLGQPATAPPAAPPSPQVGFVLKDRYGRAAPARTLKARSGGGNTDVARLRDDTLIFTMTGVVTAPPQPTKLNSAVIDFDLDQEFAIVFFDPKLKQAKLTAEAHIIGLLRGDPHGGSASVDHGAMAIACHGSPVLSLALEHHAVGGDGNLSINDHKGPVSVPVLPGDFHLVQTFRISAAHVRSLCGKAAAAEFAPDPALDPTWISVTEPFRGANKKEFGFRIILRVEPE
jgi:hypothetical protein